MVRLAWGLGSKDLGVLIIKASVFVHVPRSLNGPARDKTAKLGALFMGPIMGKKINHETYMRSLGLGGGVPACIRVSLQERYG